MKPIDADKTGIGFIRQKSSQHDTPAVRPSLDDSAPVKRSGDQLIDLLSLIHSTDDNNILHDSRFERLKADIRQDTYTIDFDLLADNLVAFDYE